MSIVPHLNLFLFFFNFLSHLLKKKSHTDTHKLSFLSHLLSPPTECHTQRAWCGSELWALLGVDQ